jgi:hypothetical protein
MRSLGVITVLAFRASPLSAQEFLPISGDGWEAFRRVEYLGGDLTIGGKRQGVLVLTDSTISFHECNNGCYNDPKKPPFKPEWLWKIRYSQMVEVEDKSQTKAASGTARFLMGASAADHNQELVTIAYESEKSAE